MQAVILCGGEGVRLRPLTCDCPKPMLPVLEKPVLRYMLEHLRTQGVTESFLTLHYLPQKIMQEMKDEPDVRFAMEEEPLGTAGCVKALERYFNGTLAVVSGDALTDVDLKAALQFHREHHADATIILKQVDRPVEYGIAALDENQWITCFQEKPAWGQVFSDLANTGMYILEPHVLSLLQEGQCADFARDLFPTMMKNGMRIAGYATKRYWCDIGSFEDYRRAQMDLLTGKLQMPLPHEVDGRGIYVAATAKADPSCMLEGPCWISDGCVLQPGACAGPEAVLGEGTVLGPGASIRYAVTGSGCSLGSQTQVRGAILADGVRIKAGAEVFDGSVLASHACVGSFSHLQGKAHLWPGKSTEPYTWLKGDQRWEQETYAQGGLWTAETWEDMPPERLFCLGQALAMMGGEGLISYCGDATVQTAWECVKAGAMSGGMKVHTVENAIAEIHRFMQRKLNIPWGTHVTRQEEGFRVLITDNRGNNLNAEASVKLWRLMGSEKKPGTGALVKEEALWSDYCGELHNLYRIYKDKIKVFAASEFTGQTVVQILNTLGMETQWAGNGTMDVGVDEIGFCYSEDGSTVFDEHGKVMGSIPAEEDQICRLLDMMQVRRQDSKEFKEPPCQERLVPCPWKKRGAVMRMIANWPDWKKEEGVFVHREQYAFSIHPDERYPLIRLVSRGLSQEESEELFGEYEKRLLDQLKM